MPHERHTEKAGVRLPRHRPGCTTHTRPGAPGPLTGAAAAQQPTVRAAAAPWGGAAAVGRAPRQAHRAPSLLVPDACLPPATTPPTRPSPRPAAGRPAQGGASDRVRQGVGQRLRKRLWASGRGGPNRLPRGSARSGPTRPGSKPPQVAGQGQQPPQAAAEPPGCCCVPRQKVWGTVDRPKTRVHTDPSRDRTADLWCSTNMIVRPTL